jgi:integrase
MAGATGFVCTKRAASSTRCRRTITYLKEAKIKANLKGLLFRSVDRHRRLTDRPMHRNGVIRMFKRRGRGMALLPGICCHTFRATGITDISRTGWICSQESGFSQLLVI